MTPPSFPDIDEALSWYIDTKNGLSGLHEAINRGYVKSSSIREELLYMPLNEWKKYHKDQLNKHEIFAVLALFAACEGGIRRDFEWRTRKNIGAKMEHHPRFCKINNGSHVSIATIIENWIAADSRLSKSLGKLLELFKERNGLAHGNYAQNVAFEHLYDQMRSIREKWCGTVSDFQRY